LTGRFSKSKGAEICERRRASVALKVEVEATRGDQTVAIAKGDVILVNVGPNDKPTKRLRRARISAARRKASRKFLFRTDA
jgi:hypothetical protein